MSSRIMAIINTSPDSFSGDAVAATDLAAVRQRLQTALGQGADLLDIGGQSTRPGAEIIDEATEIQRVVPVIAVARALTSKPISVDTFKPAVARAAIEAGATIVNDISGAGDRRMVELIKTTGVEVVVMHQRGNSKTMSHLTHYLRGVVTEVKEFLQERARALTAAGIPAERIIIDPGIGFAKTAPQCFELTRRLAEFTGLGYRVLYAASQKSFIGKALVATTGPMAPVSERAIGTAVVQSYAMLNGADIIRVHDVAAAVQARAVVEALLGQREVQS